MVLTRNGTETFVPTPTMDLPSPVASISVMDKAIANENGRLANGIWFNKFSDGPILDNLMHNFDAWNVYLHEVTTEKIAGHS